MFVILVPRDFYFHQFVNLQINRNFVVYVKAPYQLFHEIYYELSQSLKGTWESNR